MTQDQLHMNRALELAEQGWGKTNPNPLVGCVIARGETIIAEGLHAGIGKDHAERDALRQAARNGVDIRGATLYVNLEPCSHHGRTPPCTDAIVETGIAEVVVGMTDPNPIVSGRGIERLRQAGIQVRTGVMEEKCRALNEIFCTYITTGRPFVLLKAAMTLDGKIASVTGDSRWVSGSVSRQTVHKWRNRVAAVMVGSRTVCIDNPSLTTRLDAGGGRNPVRVLVDSRGVISPESRAIAGDGSARTLLATTSALPAATEEAMIQRNVEILRLDGPAGKVDLAALLRALGDRELDSVLLEGGGGLHAAMLAAGLVDKVMLFVAPKILGGESAPTWVEGDGIPRMSDALRLTSMTWSLSGEDLLVEGYVGKEQEA